MSSLQDVREEYRKLYQKAKKGSVERSVYYHLYLILVNAQDRRQAANKIKALCVDSPDLCSEALKALA